MIWGSVRNVQCMCFGWFTSDSNKNSSYYYYYYYYCRCCYCYYSTPQMMPLSYLGKSLHIPCWSPYPMFTSHRVTTILPALPWDHLSICILPFGWLPGVWILCRRFGTTCKFQLHRWCNLHRLWSWNWRSVPETSTHKIQTSGNHTKERIQHSEHGECLK